MHSLPHIWHGANHRRNVIGKAIKMKFQGIFSILFKKIIKCPSPDQQSIKSILVFFNLFAFRLRLADILVRPMQRLTKYNLLLSAIRKHIPEESEAEIMDLMVSRKVFNIMALHVGAIFLLVSIFKFKSCSDILNLLKIHFYEECLIWLLFHESKYTQRICTSEWVTECLEMFL